MILLCLFGIHFGFENTVRLTQERNIVHALPDATGETGEERRAERRRLDQLRPVDRHAQHIRLELHQERADGRAAVHTQDGDRALGIDLHGIKQVFDLIGDALERSTGNMRLVAAARQADDRTAGVHIPARRAKTGERGHEVHSAVIRHALGQNVALVRRADQTKLVAQPLDGAACIEHTALERIGRLAVD